MPSNQILIRSILKYPVLVLLTIVLGFAGAIFNGIGTLLVVPVLLELLDQGGEIKKNFPPILNTFTNSFNRFPEHYQLLAMVVVIVLMLVLKNASGYASAVVSGILNRKLATSLRRDGLKVLLDVDLDYFSKVRIGDLINHLNTEVNRTTVAVRNVIRLVSISITIGTFLILLVVTSWQLTVISIFTLGTIALLNQAMVKTSKVLGKELSDVSRAYSSRVLEVLSGIRLVKSTGNEDREYDVLDKLILERERVEYKSQLIFSALPPINEVANVCALLTIAAVGRMAFSDQLEYFSSVLLTYLLFLFRMLPFIGQLNATRGQLANTAASVAVVTEFLRRDDKPFMPLGHRPYAALQQGIRFNEITFSYPSHDETVLKGVNLYLPKGTTLALVGSSGAGKSTLADLLPRFYDPTSGSIELDGIDLRQFNVTSFRKNLGIVSQDTFLFNASVRENLLYGRPNASESELMKAVNDANATEFILQLPEGMETLIGDRGVLLSGGQRQRLAIARALLQDPDILILDEATSALDTISERLVQKALDKLSRDRTTLVIAHRLSTIQNADQIAVLDQGKVIETGTHNQLLQQGKLYAKLYQMQFSEHKDKNSSSVINDQVTHQIGTLAEINKTSYQIRSYLNNIIGVLGVLADSTLVEPEEGSEMAETAYNDALSLTKTLASFEKMSQQKTN